MSKYLLEQTDETVFQDSPYKKPDSFFVRPTVKAIVKKGDEFGFITNDASGLILFPGGGADSDDLEKEIIRECREETGWNVKIIERIGQTRALNCKNGREVITDVFIVEALNKEEEDLREDDEKDINMQMIFINPQRALHRMTLQNDAAKKGVYDIHYFSNFLVQAHYQIFKKYLEDNKLI